MNTEKVQFLYYLLCSILTLLITFVGIYQRLKKGQFLTGVTGLYFSAFIFFGIGPLAYLPVDITWERLDKDTVISCYSAVAPFFSGGLFISLVWDRFLNKKYSRQIAISDFEETFKTLNAAIFYFILSLLGYFLSKTDFALSGAGTFFPILRIFLYPTLVLCIYLFDTKKPITFIFCVIVLMLSFYLTATSEWRSQLIFFFGSIGIGLLLRSVKYMWPMIIAFLLMIMILLPFQQVKKFNYSKTQSDYFGTFLSTLEIPFSKRIVFASFFFAERINYGREMAYVQHAMNRNWLNYKEGETYEQIVLQLVPRILWPDKPSFNQYSNHYIPRRIGLVGEEVEYTSWGVNAYAEFIMNFHYKYLLVFVPLLFGVVNIIDRLISSIYKNPIIMWVTSTSFFFTTFEMVGVVNVSTYILWLLIINKLIEVLFRMRLNRPLKYDKPLYESSDLR